MRPVLNRSLVPTLAALSLCLMATIPVGAAPSWTTVAPTLRYQADSVAAAAPNGRIYVFGDTTLFTSDEVYDPAANSWTMLPPMNPGRYRMAIATLNGKFYVFGGVTAGIGVRRLNQMYDPATNTWSKLAPMPLGGEYLAASAGTDGKIYVFGGDRKHWGIDGLGDLRAVQIYDPATNTWTFNRDLPAALRAGAATLGSDGRIYVIGGYIPNRRAQRSGPAWAYDTSTRTFTKIHSLGWYRSGLGAASGDGVIYAIGGLHVGDVENVATYDIKTDTWSHGPLMPTVKAYGGVAETSGGAIYAIAGFDESLDSTKTVYALRP